MRCRGKFISNAVAKRCYTTLSLSFSRSTGLLLAMLKATLNLLHKLAVVLGDILSDDVNDIHELNWPDKLKEGTSAERSEWTRRQLASLEACCENLLVQGAT